VEHSYGAYYDLSTWEQDPANVEHIWLYDLHIKPTVNSNVVSPLPLKLLTVHHVTLPVCFKQKFTLPGRRKREAPAT